MHKESTFLNRIIPARRSAVVNTFLYAIREGYTDPRDIYFYAAGRASRLAENPGEYGEQYRDLGAMMIAYREEVQEFIRDCLEWEALPSEEKDRIKQEKGRVHAMSGKPATEKQIAFLRSKGVEPPEDRLHASEMIDRIIKGEG